jgi:hypothetical protein
VTRAVLVPSTLLLLPEYAGLVDPVPELRAACREVVASLVAERPRAVGVVAAPGRPDNLDRGVTATVGSRVARALLGDVGWSGEVVEVTGAQEPALPLLVVGNGSARRSERAPGHLDPRSEPFDAALGTALVTRDAAALAALDPGLAQELWCHDVAAYHRLAAVLPPGAPASVRRDEDPFGVQYWVLSWA